MHTALGVIGFPYQFMFAVTGAVLILNTVLLTPFTKYVYKGDTQQLNIDLKYSHKHDLAYSYSDLGKDFRLSKYLRDASDKYKDAEMKRLFITNYGDKNMLVTVELEPPYNQIFAGSGIVTYQVQDGAVLRDKSPVGESDYIDVIKSLIYRLHFGDFGGYPVKIMYFILGIMGCIVIISGILIWLVAREKPHVSLSKRKFNFWTANVFLAICLSMLPVTTLSFIIVKISPHVNQEIICRIYFSIWLLSSIYFIVRKNLNRTQREAFLWGGILSLLIPVVNGLCSSSWLIGNLIAQRTDIFVVDFLWLSIGAISLSAWHWNRKHELKSTQNSAAA